MKVKQWMVFSVVTSLLGAACGPTQIVEVIAQPEFVPTPELVIVEQRATDGTAVKARVRFNRVADEVVDAIVDGLEVVPRAELEAELAELEPADGRFTIPEARGLPMVQVRLEDDAGVALEGYGYRVRVPVRLKGDKSAGGPGVAAPSGLGLVGCAISVLRTSSIPDVHLMELRAVGGSSGARLNAAVDAVGLTTELAETHLGLVANGFYERPLEVQLEMGCAD